MKTYLWAAALLFAAPAAADTLVDHVDGITLDESGKLRRFTGLVIGDDGRIEQVLARGDKRPGKPDFYVDGKGRVMLPGMIDSHAHLMGVGLGTVTLDLSQTRSLAEAQAKIAAYVKAHPDRPWIIGRGWNQELWGLGRFPTAGDLDAVVADRPVWLERVDGHAGWANTAALNAAQVGAATRDPVGGHIERVAGSAKPAGVLVDNAKALVERVVPQPRPEDLDAALYAAQNVMFGHGITAVAVMGTPIEHWQAYRRAGDNGTLRLRIMAYAEGVEAMELIGGPGPSPWLYEDRLRLNGVKLYADGALGSRGAALKTPYADEPKSTGLRLLSDTQLKNLMSRAAMDHFQIAVHAIGDAANASVLDAIGELAETYKGDRRWRIEHAQVVDPADIPKFGKFGVIASMQPVHQTSDRLMAEARLGTTGPNGARLAGAYAWRSIAATGARLVFGSDAPVEEPDPFAGFAAAITRQGPDGEPYGGWQAQERVTREAALAAYTSDGAWAGFGEGRFGRLSKGQRADFVLVDHDPLLATPAEIRAMRVSETWVGGARVFAAPSTDTK